MKIIKVDLNKNYDEAIAEACRVLHLGGVVVYPTDTVYGLGANACDNLAVDQVFKIKKRSYTKPLPVVARNLDWVKELVYIDSRNRRVVESIWPGAVTAILPKRDYLSSLVTAKGLSVGVRIPDFHLVDRLLGKFGYPLTATSANISGEESTNDIDKIVARFEGQRYRPNLILDAGILPKSQPFTVLDLTADQPRILRVGPSRPEQLLKILGISKKE
ncbi:MAG: L-threonylcarbamoyladenylate synthase [bacterium]|nr:L-threonylcarbamoyladenylate synthase [bacterium]